MLVGTGVPALFTWAGSFRRPGRGDSIGYSGSSGARLWLPQQGAAARGVAAVVGSGKRRQWLSQTTLGGSGSLVSSAPCFLNPRSRTRLQALTARENKYGLVFHGPSESTQCTENQTETWFRKLFPRFDNVVIPVR